MAVALELMVLALRLDTLVAGVWIYHLWQWAQVLRLFIQRAYRVGGVQGGGVGKVGGEARLGWAGIS